MTSNFKYDLIALALIFLFVLFFPFGATLKFGSVALTGFAADGLSVFIMYLFVNGAFAFIRDVYKLFK